MALLPAYVQIMLAAADVDAAAGACRELDEIATQQGNEAIDAMSLQARGAVSLAEGDAQAALPRIAARLQAWQELEAPYEAARSRALLGRACRLLGDEDSTALELRGGPRNLRRARRTARPGGDRASRADEGPGDAHGLSPREQEVLRLVATGKSNREIATALVLSEHTVARHLQNIFAKLGVSSRTAASAFAYEHGLA